MISQEFSHKLINHIMAYENPQMSDVSLHIKENEEPNIYFIDPFFRAYRTFFLVCETRDGSSLFNLRSLTSLSAILSFLAFPENYKTNPLSDDGKFISELVWLNAFVRNMKAQFGMPFFKEIATSTFVDFSVKINNENFVIKLNFSKYSEFLNKNIDYNIYFDMSFNFMDVEFFPYSSNDSNQVQNLSKFNGANKMMAFYVLFHYYTNVEVHNSFDSMLDIDNELNNDNLSMFDSLICMNEI